MRITKFGHACVRIEDGNTAIVIDPGVFTGLDAVDEATAILITHEHPDHWTPDHLRAAERAPIFTIEAVAEKIREQAPDVAERVTVVRPRDVFDPGVRVQVIGEKHAVIYDQLPHFDNSGYLLDLDGFTMFHPGDALTVPPVEVDLLFLPVSAPWLKVSECIDYARTVDAKKSVAIHDEIYSEAGLGIVDGHLKRFLGEERNYVRVKPGTELSLR